MITFCCSLYDLQCQVRKNFLLSFSAKLGSAFHCLFFYAFQCKIMKRKDKWPMSCIQSSVYYLCYSNNPSFTGSASCFVSVVCKCQGCWQYAIWGVVLSYELTICCTVLEHEWEDKEHSRVKASRQFCLTEMTTKSHQ